VQEQNEKELEAQVSSQVVTLFTQEEHKPEDSWITLCLIFPKEENILNRVKSKYQDPWLSVPISRWVWLYVEKDLSSQQVNYAY
jgi:hypothetical protein